MVPAPHTLIATAVRLPHPRGDGPAYTAPGSLHGDRIQDSFLARGWRLYTSRQGSIQACPRCGRRLLARGLEPVAHDIAPATQES